MSHKFNPAHMEKLDNPERRELLPPGKMLIDLGLKEGYTVLDIGAGIGYFTIPASKIVGEKGKVIAVDTSEEMIEELKHRVSSAHMKNIEIVKSEEYDFGITNGAVDFALLSQVLHEIDNKKRFLLKVHEILKASGEIALIEWERDETAFGPPIEHRIDRTELIKMLDEIGFHNIMADSYNKYFYTVTGGKGNNTRR
jgi:ubiquinone/menaquinone biosynthesis C-methylase UbiE